MGRWGTWREDLVLLVGLAGLGYETVVEHVDRPVLLGVFGGMATGKIFIGRDRRRQKGRGRRDGSR